VTWRAVLENDKPYTAQLTVFYWTPLTHCHYSECTRYLYQIQWFFWLGFICCCKTSVQYICCQPLLLRNYYQV